jgi:dTDP-4-amino-4,6-dideoxygalactose transaminase
VLALKRLPPAGTAYPMPQWRAALRPGGARAELIAGLSDRLEQRPLTLHRSGREALRVAFEALARADGRGEIAVPAYTCYSVPAAAVAAGLAVRLIDTDDMGRIDPASLAQADLRDCAALVVGNLFGVPEPLASIRPLLRQRGVALVDDAAQGLGAFDDEGPVGARGDIGILSFGRGKPLSGLGGGAIVWPRAESSRGLAASDTLRKPGAASEGAAEAGSRGAAALLLRIATWNLALRPSVFRLLAEIPGLGIGETHFDPDFAQGAMTAEAASLARAALVDFERETRSRRERALELAGALRARTRFTPLLATPAEAGVYPRLGVLAPDPEARREGLARLRLAGVTGMYPSSLDAVPALRPRKVGPIDTPGARAFAARVLTLPTHAGVSPAWRERIVSGLERCA